MGGARTAENGGWGAKYIKIREIASNRPTIRNGKRITGFFAKLSNNCRQILRASFILPGSLAG